MLSVSLRFGGLLKRACDEDRLLGLSLLLSTHLPAQLAAGLGTEIELEVRGQGVPLLGSVHIRCHRL